MRVKLPDSITDKPYRWKRGGVVEVESREEVDELVRRGGALLPDETSAAAPAPPKAPKGSRGRKQ